MALLGPRHLAFRLAVIALTAVAVRANAEGPAIDEYQVKAAFLYNFAKFVEWPPEAVGSSNGPIAICVLGQNPFGHALQDTVDGKTVSGRTFVVRQTAEAKQAAHCQILFVSSSERKRYAAILGELRAGGVLTVGETEDFAEAGGVVNLKLESSRVQIQINMSAAEEAGLHISSKLLSLAQIIRKAGPAK